MAYDRCRQGKVASIAAVSCLVLMAGATAQQIEVSPTVVVAEDADGVASWSHVVAHPTDADRLMICGALIRPRGAMPGATGFVAVSHDGGGSWRRTLTDSGAAFSSEHSGAFGRGDRAYFAATHDHAEGGLWLYRSDDGGLSWHEPAGPAPFVDLTAMAVDVSPASPHRDRLYLFGHFARHSGRRGPMPLLRSEDGGRTLRPPAFPPDDGQPDRPITFPGGAVVLEDGTALAVYQSMHRPAGSEGIPPQALPKYVELLRSADGGRSVSIATVARYEYWLADGALPDLPSIAAGAGRAGGGQVAYVAWTDLAAGRSEVWLAASRDGGETWSAPARVDDLDGVMEHDVFVASHPNVAVGQDGIVAVSWRDIRRDCWRVSASLDGGLTFGPSMPLTTSHRDGGASPLDGVYSIAHGSDVGLAADAAGRYHAAWSEELEGGYRLLSVRFLVGHSPGEAPAGIRNDR
ncbi:sialidase family protein [Tautonia sociabilis]|uniref:Exo-alpha-sialidase n=1 Tax=Tautonia sociabilis TaxID=2080755 RepID=A0A432MDL1_9BACT|nr:sialidase family protein [Tautonia sociabilis]RUL82814.1 exo-alpha-sialidase [Tautonia sociabilis]